VCQKLAQSLLNGATQSVDIEAEGRKPTMDKQWLKKGIPNLAEDYSQNQLINLTNVDKSLKQFVICREVNFSFIYMNPRS